MNLRLKTKTGIARYCFLLLLFLGFFFNVQDFPTLVMPAIGANRVRKAHFSAVAALNQVRGLECILSAAAVSSTF